jgi:hypothetical protein
MISEERNTMKNNVRSVQPMSEMAENRPQPCQHSGQAPISPAQRWTLCVASLFLIVICVGCGGGGYNANDVTVSVSPATATVSENGQMAFKATITGECEGCVPTITWSISEDSESNCTWIETPPTGPCPGGTVQVPEFSGSLTATYFAPNTSGSFHIVASEFVTYTQTQQGTSVITVTP